jgi:hypothetical protein
MGVVNWWLKHPAGELAGWWDQNKKESEKALNDFVDAYPHLWVIAATVQTTMDVGSGFVDVLRFGEGAAEFHETGKVAPLIQDAFRGMTIASGAAKVLGSSSVAGRLGPALGRKIGLYVDVAPESGICSPISVANAIRRTGQRVLMCLDDIAQAHGFTGIKAAAWLEGASMEESVSALKFLKVEHEIIPQAGSWENVVKLAQQRKGVLMLRVVDSADTSANPAGHRIVLEAGKTGVRIIDRTGLYRTLEDLSTRYALKGKWVVDGKQFAVLVKNVCVRIVNGLPTFMGYANALVPKLRGNTRVEELDKKFQAFKAQQGIKSPAGTPGGPKSVTVRNGDTLSGLAQQYYGSSDLWPLLWDANKGTVGTNPNRITPGMPLQIPPLSSFTPAQIAEAKRRNPTWRSYPMAAGR